MRSRRTSRALLLLLVAALAMPATVLAESQRGRRGQARPQARPAGGALGNFEAVAPAVGDAMPDIAVYDADGNEHRLPSLLRGHYSVLILGCLT